jgi:hypothetical protein
MVPSGLVDTLPTCAPKENVMRLRFPNSTRPKKAAKALSDITTRPLASCQQAVAKASGYRDWHDLEGSYSLASDCLPENDHQSDDVVQREVSLVLSTVKLLGANAGDVQYALAISRLSGNRSANPCESVEIRRKLFEVLDLPPVGRRERGAIGKAKIAGGHEFSGSNGAHLILREFGKPTRVVTHKSADAILADFEYVSPRRTLPLFIPMRLYVPYGVWTESDGAKVLFSRDYKPLWRIRDGQSPERIFPWLRIKYVDQSWFWEGANAPWHTQKIYENEMDRLKGYGVRAMPILAEALPLVIQHHELKNFIDAVPILQGIYSR